MAKKLKYRILLGQGWGKLFYFHLTEEEYKAMPYFSNANQRANFSWFAWADYDLSPSKKKRFNKLFDYNKGDFNLYESTEFVDRAE